LDGFPTVTREQSVIRALGAYGSHKYPGFSDVPLDGFRHLRSDLDSDLDNFFLIFIAGSDEELSGYWR